MNVKIIVMSHGQMAAETVASAKMIVGELADIAVVSMEAEDGLTGTQVKLDKILKKYGDVPTLIIADLKGGTPCNVAMMALGEYTQLRVLSGLNLAMLIEASVSAIEDIDELTEYLQMIGQQAVTMIELPDLDDELDEFEE
ncbi:PTS sugar transporter subunit IIA [Enterococcus sp. LJL99]